MAANQLAKALRELRAWAGDPSLTHALELAEFDYSYAATDWNRAVEHIWGTAREGALPMVPSDLRA
jgi:hypothetical protein